ncbi:DUF3427 domain-containing protein [Duganella sp. Dugasp56]|uniref:DUF3427 domain-containing protein n=1 Tax=Duganella sp. Dugasp56 TaxID=3243046 RepID=UPI0039AECD56
MKYKERNISSVGELLAALKSHVKPGEIVWHRGQTNKNWGLVPSLAREDGKHLHKENALYKRFIQNATQLLEHPPDFDDEWQNATAPASKKGRDIIDHVKNGIAIHLFVRESKLESGKGAPFVYHGPVTYQSHTGSSPMSVVFKIL